MMVYLDSSLLIIESSVKNSTIYQNYLRSTGCGYNLSIVTSIAQGLDLCRTSTIAGADGKPFDTVLLGGSISALDGLAFLESLAAQSGIDRPTVIIVATEGDHRIAVRAIKLGAQDYLLEGDLTPELLQSAVTCGIEKARLQLQLQECNDRFRVAMDNVLDSMAIFSAIRDQTGQIIDFRFDYLNPSALASNHMTAADTHRSLCEIFPSVRETGLFGNYCRVVETGEPLVQDNLIYSDTFGTQYLTRVYDLRVVKLDDGVIASWRDVTDRQQTEIALQTSEERLRLALEAAELGTVDFNLLTGQVIWNATAEVFMGCVPGAAATYTYADFEARVHPDDRAGVNADLARERLRQRPDWTSEFRVILPDGSIRWLRGFGRFYDDDGRAVRMLGTIEDITAAKCADRVQQQAEDELRQAQALAQSQLMEIEAIYQTAPIGLAIIDGDLRFGRVNQTLAEINGIAIDAHIGRTVREVVPDFADEVEPIFRRILETGEAVLNLEISGETKAQPGVCRTWIENWYPLQDETGQNIGINVVMQEITERKHAELALRESEQRYKALIDITAQIVWNADAEGTILNSNSGIFTGQSQEEYQGWGWTAAIHPEDLHRTSELWLLAVANLTPYEIEHRVRRWDGEYRLMSARAVPLLDADGSVREWVGLHTDITEVRQDEENLRRSEEFNRRILENNQDCIKVLDLEGRLLYMNDGGQKLLEIDDFADYDRSLWTHFWGGGERELAQAAFTAATAGTIGKFEGRCPTVTGVPKWWEVSVIPLHDEDGHVEQILLISHDVTERRQAEDELRQAQALAQRQLVEIEAIYQTAPVGLAIMDVDLRFERVNQRLAEINGVAIADHIGRTVREVIPDLADGNEPPLRRVLETGSALLNLELSGETIAHPGFRRTWISNFYPIEDRTGQSVSINVVVQEITERKIAEQELVESQARLKAGIEVAGVGLAKFNYATNLVELSPEAAALYGFSPNESVVTREQIHATFHPDERAELEQVIARVIDPAGQGWFAQDHRVVWPNGEVRCLSVRKQVFFNRSGAVHRPSYAILAAIDITERKQIEKELDERNQELNRFSHTISHDLKAPLRGISNLATWISDDLPPTIDSDILANLELMQSRVARMDSLIDGLLEYARVGSTVASLATFSVEQLLAEIVDSLSIPDSFVVELPAALPPITTNRVLLSQVLANLIGNAYKHHDRADGRIQVTAQPDAKLWGFSVTDDGCGIAPEHQAEVFDIFKTLSGNDKNSTGIGLSIVKKLVETHGGNITLESQLGVGTTFNFTWNAEL